MDSAQREKALEMARKIRKNRMPEESMEDRERFVETLSERELMDYSKYAVGRSV